MLIHIVLQNDTPIEAWTNEQKADERVKELCKKEQEERKAAHGLRPYRYFHIKSVGVADAP